MRGPQRSSAVPPLAALSAAAPLTPTTAALGAGSFAAAAAAELRWERGLGELAGLSLLLRQPAPAPAWARNGALASLAYLLLDESAPARAAAPLPTSPLWGAPLHLLCALACVGAGLYGYGTGGRGPRGVAVLPLGGWLLALGLCWNGAQAGARHSWAWDWIEAAPLALLAAHLWQRHHWGGAATFLGLGGYLGLLQVSRASLLASAHHLQLPAAAYPAPEGALGFSAAAPLAPLLLGPVVSAFRPPRPALLRKPSAPAPQRPWDTRPHSVAAGAVGLALAPAWAPHPLAPFFLGTGLLGHGQRSSTERRRPGRRLDGGPLALTARHVPVATRVEPARRDRRSALS